MTVLSILIYVLVGIVTWGLTWSLIAKLSRMPIDDADVGLSFVAYIIAWPICFVMFSVLSIGNLISTNMGCYFRKMRSNKRK